MVVRILVILLLAAAVAGCGPADSQLLADSGAEERAALFAEEEESCRGCHRKLNPGLVAHLEQSPHERVPVLCRECHGDDHDRIFAEKGAVPPSVCGECHGKAWEEFQAGRHGRYLQEGKPNPLLRENAMAVGSCGVTSGCHSIQKRYEDGSVGRCNGCHPTHAFSNHEARNPRVCAPCHSGKDNPEYEAWLLSAHSFESPTGDGPVADCVACHGTHDVSQGITHGLSPVSSEAAPTFLPVVPLAEFRKQREIMLGRCRPCHTTRFAREALELADRWRRNGAMIVEEAGRIVTALAEADRLDPPPANRIPNPASGGHFVLGGPQIYDLQTSLPERIYYDMRFHLYPALWRAVYHTDPEIVAWERNDELKAALDRLRDLQRELMKGRPGQTKGR